MINHEAAIAISARLAMLKGWCVAGRDQESIEMFALIEIELQALRDDIAKAFGYKYNPQTKSTISEIDAAFNAGESPRDILDRLNHHPSKRSGS